MNLQEKINQISQLTRFAVWLSDHAKMPETPSPELGSLPKKPYQDQYKELQPSAEEQIIYMMADTVIATRKDWQFNVASAFLQNSAVSTFMQESEWQGIAVHGYMLPHLAPEAQLHVFRRMCNLSHEKSDDFGAEMIGAIKDMDVSLRAEAVRYVLSSRFMKDLQESNPSAYLNDVSRLQVLEAASYNCEKRSEYNQFFRDAARDIRDTDRALAANLLRAAREIGKGRHAEPS